MAIYPSITSTVPGRWQTQLQEIKELGIKEFCLFPTAMDQMEREEMYRELRKLKIKRIPLIHLKSEMEKGEVKYLKENFPVEVFNIHITGNYPNKNDYGEYKKDVFVENLGDELDEEIIKDYGGMCLDLAHLENNRLSGKNQVYQQNLALMKTYKIGVDHINSIKKELVWDRSRRWQSYESHSYLELSEFDFVVNYREFISEIVALELENSIEEQLVAKEYVEKLLAGR